MKYIARLRFNIVDGMLVEADTEHIVLIPSIQEPSKIFELSLAAKQHIYNHVEVGRLVNGQKIILLLAGNLEYRSFPEHEDWMFDLKIEWSSLEIIPMVPIKGGYDV